MKFLSVLVAALVCVAVVCVPKTPVSAEAERPFPPGGLTIRVRWVILGVEVNNARVARQMRILNERFSPVNIRFRTVEVVRKPWPFAPCDRDSLRAAQSIFSSASVLNVGVCRMGFAAGFVSMTQSNDPPYATTVFLNPDFVAGSPVTLGLVAVHEVGHAFGLSHPWGERTGDCTRDGDGIADTPVQSKPATTTGCRRSQDSCPSRPGLDSVGNYMDYSAEECRYYFTPGQIRFMQSFIARYRPGLMPPPPPPSPPSPPAKPSPPAQPDLRKPFRLRLLGRASCPARGFLSAAAGCKDSRVSLGPPVARTVWFATNGAWGVRTSLANRGRVDALPDFWVRGCPVNLACHGRGVLLGGACCPSYNTDNFVPVWLGNGRVRLRVQGLGQHAYVGISANCSVTRLGVHDSRNPGSLVTWSMVSV